MKTRELKVAEQFYVKNHLSEKTVEEFAAELETSVKTVQNFLDTLPKEVVENTDDSSPPVPESDIDKIAGASNIQGDRPNQDGHFIMTRKQAMTSNQYDEYGNLKEAIHRAVQKVFDEDVRPIKK